MRLGIVVNIVTTEQQKTRGNSLGMVQVYFVYIHTDASERPRDGLRVAKTKFEC